jgi:pimeloyl-ACP methyl ester carboxylesterase
MGHTSAPAALRSADDVLDTLLGFTDEVAGAAAVLVVGHSAGAYCAQGIAARRPEWVAGLALVCPLLTGARDVPAKTRWSRADNLGDDEFRGYFVVQTPEMLDRYERSVAPAIPMADDAAIERMSGSVSGRCCRSGMVAAAHSRGRAWTRGGAGSVYAASTREHGFGESSLSHPE